MTDLVERLRKPSGIGEPMDHMAMEEAADEIDRLRAALRNIRDIVTTDDDWPADSVVEEVRAALGDNP